MINLVTTVDKLTMNECIQIHHIANKFQKHQVHFHIGVNKDYDQHFMTSLIRKLDWEIKNHNSGFDFSVYSSNQIYDKTKSTATTDLKWALIEDYLKDHLHLDYIVYVNPTVIFSQQPTPEMWKNIETKTNWFGGDSLIYGKNLQMDQEWVCVEEYPLIENKEQVEPSPRMGIFSPAMLKDHYYISWHNFIKESYMTGKNLFDWETKI